MNAHISPCHHVPMSSQSPWTSHEPLWNKRIQSPCHPCSIIISIRFSYLEVSWKFGDPMGSPRLEESSNLFIPTWKVFALRVGPSVGLPMAALLIGAASSRSRTAGSTISDSAHSAQQKHLMVTVLGWESDVLLKQPPKWHRNHRSKNHQKVKVLNLVVNSYN